MSVATKTQKKRRGCPISSKNTKPKKTTTQKDPAPSVTLIAMPPSHSPILKVKEVLLFFFLFYSVGQILIALCFSHGLNYEFKFSLLSLVLLKNNHL